MSVLFIGLGGVGTHTLKDLNDKMVKYHNDVFARTGNAVTEKPKYLFIDTDNSIFKTHKNNFYPLNNDNYFIQIGERSPDEIRIANERDYHISDWCDAPSKNTSMILGADSTRQYSRLALLDNYIEIESTLQKMMKGFNDNDRIYLVSGSAGGTGSGIFMDILFMIDQIYKANKTLQRGPNTRFIIAMPNGYIPSGNDSSDNVQRLKTQLNAFATLQELNDVCRDKETQGGSCFGTSAVVKPKTPRTSFQPFRFGYLYESHNLTPPEVCQQISDFVFEIELAGIEESKHPGQGFDTDLTNKVDTGWNHSIKSNSLYTKAFCAMGQFSIEKPDWLWREYFEHRLLHQLFHEGLLGDNNQQKDTRIFQLLRQEIGKSIERTVQNINGIIPSSEFTRKDPPRTYWNIINDTPDTLDEQVKKVLAYKDQLLENVKKNTYIACRKAMMEYSIDKVLRALEQLDAEYYESAVKENTQLPLAVIQAMKDHNKYLKKGDNIKTFLLHLSRWLSYHVARALSSSPKSGDEINIRDRGYLDICQDFLKIAKKECELEEDLEKWETLFKNEVANLKAKDNRCYIPNLDSIVKNGEVLEKSQLVSLYNSIVLPSNGNMLDGTCTIVELHQEVLRKLESDPELGRRVNGDEGYMAAMFDPDPNRTDGLRGNAMAFSTEYVTVAKSIISDIVKRNKAVQKEFSSNIIQRLTQRGKDEQATIFSRFHEYGGVNLQTQPMAAGAITQQVLYISDFHGNTELQKKLGINIALSSSIIDQPEFGDKIVKLIVNCGYCIDDYRYFDDYKRFAEEKLVDNISHDPFIDKRFLGQPVNGKYPLSVWDALHQNVVTASQNESYNANLYDLSKADLREVYGMCIALMHEYFKQLSVVDAGKGKIIPKEMAKGIKHLKGLTYTLITYKYAPARKKYMEGDTNTINIKAKSIGINDLVDFSWWIDFIQQRRDNVSDHGDLIAKAIEAIEAKGKGIALSEEMNNILNNIVVNEYDFFDAYNVWFKNKTKK